MSFDPTYLVSQLTALNREDGDLRLICDGVVVKAHSFILSLRYGARENFLLLLMNLNLVVQYSALYSITGLDILRRPSQLVWEMLNPNWNLR